MKLKFIILAFLLFSLSLVSCSDSKKTNEDEQEETFESNDNSSEKTENKVLEKKEINFNSDFEEVFQGELGGKKIGMFLSKNGTELNGKYFYKGHKGDLLLWGSLSSATVQLQERAVSGQATGKIEAEAENSEISGKWLTPNGKKRLDFSVKAVDASWQELKKDGIDGASEKLEEILNHIPRAELPMKTDDIPNILIPMPKKNHSFFGVNLGMQGNMESYSYWFFYPMKDFVIISYVYNYEPGGGRASKMVELATFKYNGKRIDYKEIGSMEYNFYEGPLYASTKFKISKNFDIEAVSFEEIGEEDSMQKSTLGMKAFSISSTGKINSK